MMTAFARRLPGVGLILGITALAILLGQLDVFNHWGLSPLTLAIVLGMLIGNSIYPKIAKSCFEGVLLSKGKILRLGIILYGFRLTITQLMVIGANGLVSDILILSSTFMLTYMLGTRWLKMDEDTVILMGAGASICGAAAVAATEPVLRPEPAHVSVAIATVVIFGTMAIFLYPQIYAWGGLDLDAHHFGIYIGSSVHEVAQVVAAGRAISEEAMDTAVTVKMLRVMMLAPFLLVLMFFLRKNRQHSQHVPLRQSFPWFALWFIGVVLLHSWLPFPQTMVTGLVQLDTLLLTMAMAALGVTTHWSAIRQAGLRPLILGAVVMLWLVSAGALIQIIWRAIVV